MPVSYQFTRGSEPVTLNEVDEFVCEQVGAPPHPERYHYVFQMVVVDGLIAALIKNGGTDITCSHMLWIMDIMKNDTDEGSRNAVELLCRVVEEYDFRAWR